MAKRLPWRAPALAVVSIASPACAAQYLDISEARKRAFPAANRLVEQGARVWKAQAGDSMLGLIVVDHVIAPPHRRRQENHGDLSQPDSVRRAKPLLGTFVEITVRDATPIRVDDEIDCAFDAIARGHRSMSFHDRKSDISRLNLLADWKDTTSDAA
jgi:hypothetical protein